MKNQKGDSDALTMAIVSIFAISILLGCFFGFKKMSVWSASISGQAELKQAEWNRQIKVQEAESSLKSAHYLALAEVERAKGVAEANKIIGSSLKGNEAYLRYLWIHSLQETKDQIIYIPTEGGLPILESTRLKKDIVISNQEN